MSKLWFNVTEYRRKAIFFATIMENPWVHQKPTANIKQQEFVECFDREALYGGSAGGGKSSALLMSAAQFLDEPGYAALLLRRSYADLSLPGALMDRAADWWGGKAKWNGQEHKWTFPSGATITFGYLENEKDKFRYQGAELQFIGFDELTQFSQSQYTYLFSRLRRLQGSCIPLRIRGATNPGGVGHEWVKKRFITPGATRRFVPAKLHDNPHVDRDDYIQSLAELDPITRSQLLAGSWDDIEGGRFRREWMRYYQRNGPWLDFPGASPGRYDANDLRDRFLTVDTAATVKQTVKDDPDYTVISAWGMTPCRRLLSLGCVRFRAEVPDIAPRVAECYVRFKAGKVVIEGGGTQKGVVQLARRHALPGGTMMNVIEYLPGTQELLLRAASMMNACEAGRVWLPSNDPAYPLEDVESEVFRFTGSPKLDGHDDIVSTWSMAGDVLAGKDFSGMQPGFQAVRLRHGVGAFR